MTRTMMKGLALGGLSLLLLTGCVSNKKYQRLQSDYVALQKNYDETNRKLGDVEAELTSVQKQLEEKISSSDKEIEVMKKTYEELSVNLKKEISGNQVEIERIQDRLTMRIAEELFFESGKAEIRPQGREVLLKIGASLKKIPEKNIRVEGNTDNVPIGPALRSEYPTNWELGAARAVNVVKFLQEEAKIDPLRLSAVSFGQYRPRTTNRTSAGRAKNRRIEIVLVNRDLDLAKKMRENLPAK
jgi:chemotaxis protein MotB